MTRIAIAVEKDGKTISNAVHLREGVPIERGMFVLLDWLKQQRAA